MLRAAHLASAHVTDPGKLAAASILLLLDVVPISCLPKRVGWMCAVGWGEGPFEATGEAGGGFEGAVRLCSYLIERPCKKFGGKRSNGSPDLAALVLAENVDPPANFRERSRAP